MNEQIRKAKPKRPVIVLQNPDGSKVESNDFLIKVDNKIIGAVSFYPSGLPECTTHDVKAWVEFIEEVILIPVARSIETPAPTASPKKSNSKVKT
jgi:hypothetical protein